MRRAELVVLAGIAMLLLAGLLPWYLSLDPHIDGKALSQWMFLFGLPGLGLIGAGIVMGTAELVTEQGKLRRYQMIVWTGIILMVFFDAVFFVAQMWVLGVLATGTLLGCLLVRLNSRRLMRLDAQLSPRPTMRKGDSIEDAPTSGDGA